MEPELKGGCACGAVRYRLASPPMFVQACHCNRCRKESGAPFVVNAQIETDCIEIERGSPKATPVPTDSGRPHDIYRCPDCGSALWSDYGRRAVLRFLRVSTLDDPAGLPPQAHIFTATRLPWLKLGSDTPSFEVNYDMAALWPPESLERRRALGT